MEDVHFERQYRTANSEGYLIVTGEERLGRLELHYSSTIVYGTLIVEREIEEEDVLDLIEDIDDELVLTADVPREDFIVTVYQAREIGTYSDEFFEDEDEDDEDADDDDGGHNGKSQR